MVTTHLYLYLQSLSAFSLALALSFFAGLTPVPAQAVSSDIVISQVYGGGNAGPTFKNGFIELFNRGAAPVDVTGWSAQYAITNRATWHKTNLSGVIQPGQYYLIQEAAGAGGAANLPTPDATGNIAMSAAGAQVALVNNLIPLTGACPSGPGIIDLVGYGGVNCSEGYPAPAPNNMTAALRKEEGCLDTDNNNADFVTGAPNPRNSASPAHYCSDSANRIGIGTAMPSSIAPGDTTLLTVAVTPGHFPSSIGLSVMGDLTSIGGSATQTFYDDGSHGDAVAGDNTFSFLATIPIATAPGAKNLIIHIADVQLRAGSAFIALVVEPPAMPIYEIQGSGDASPHVGELVKTHGIVTVILGNGFFMQDLVGDGDLATSDGVFVFTGSSLARAFSPGDQVTVIGTIAEYRPSTRPRDLTLTELTSVIVVKTGSGAPLPPPALISNRPDTVIAPAGFDAFERLEGMLVAIDRPKVVAPTTSSGEFVVVAAGDVSHTTPSGNLLIQQLGSDSIDYNPERIMVDDEARIPGATGEGARINNPQVNVAVAVGDVATGNIVGALDYQFGNYRVQANHPISTVLVASTLTSPIANLRPVQPYEGRIATFNVENLFDCVDAPGKDDPASCDAVALAALEIKLAKLAAAFQLELRSPEVVIVEGIENAAVLTGDARGFVPGTQIKALLPRLSGRWNAISFDASDSRGIDISFVYNADRVRLRVAPNANAFLSTALLPDRDGIFNGAVYRAGQEPLVGFFTLDDVDVIVVGAHLKSRGGSQYDATDDPGDDPLYGAFQPPVRWTEELRHKQADYIRSLVDLVLALRPGAKIVVGGDLNAFSFPEPGEGRDTLTRIQDSPTAPLIDVVDQVPQDSRYTALFEGNSQVLDHILLNAGMRTLLRDQGIAHFNANFPDVFMAVPTVMFRTSDHDPVVAYFCTDATPPSLTVNVSPSVLWSPNHRYVTVKATVRCSDNADPNPALTLMSATSNELDNSFSDGDMPDDIVIVDSLTFKLRAERSVNGSGRFYTLTYRATDACGNSSVAIATVSVPYTRGK